MKKFTALLLSTAVFLALPTASLAANLSNLNGLTTATQTFATGTTTSNSPHLLIQSSVSVHTFKWDGTPWLLSQGGTGATTTFATSSILFINNGRFSEDNLHLFWDAVNSILDVGGTTTPSAKLSIRGSGTLGLLNVASTMGTTLFYIDSGGNVGISTTTPSEKLEVVGNGKFSGSLQANTLAITATSTMGGSVGIGNTNPQAKLDVSGAIYSRLVTDTDSSSVTIDWSAGNIHTITLNTSTTTLIFANAQSGGEYKLIVNQDSTGGRQITWPASIEWAGGSASLTSAASSIDVISFIYTGSAYLGSITRNYTSPVTAAVLVVAGGGSAGDGYAGGGGGGGVVYNSAVPINVGSYSITVGTGGSAPGSSQHGNDGGNSYFGSLLNAAGGGGGGTYYATQTGDSGGSGGGGSGAPGGSGGSTGGSGTAGQGYAGGSGSGASFGGGGGGAGGIGQDGSSGGAGGTGVSYSISGSSVTYAAGGSSTSPADGGANTGNGGSSNAGAGGSGIVIISYPTGSLTASGGTVTTSGGNTIHTFTSNGTFTVSSIP